MQLIIIVAMSENRVIGREGKLPWHLPNDLKRFRRLTEGNAVVMGRRTFDSIGKPLSRRDNIVLSRQPNYRVAGAQVFASLDEALKALADRERVYIVGGGEIYREAMDQTDRIELTIVHQHFEGDTFFPEIPADFVETAREAHDEPIPHSFVTFERRGSGT